MVGKECFFSISQEKDRYTVLHHACFQYEECKSSAEIIHFSIDHGGEKLVFMADRYGRTPLYHTCTLGLECVVE